MKLGIFDEDCFDILSDSGQIIGGAMILGKKWIEVTIFEFYQDEFKKSDIQSEACIFAEQEARRLGMIDD